MAKKKQKKGKKKQDNVPIENLEFYKKDLEALQRHAIKVGAEINNIRNERRNLEIDRDNLIHYYVNAVRQLVGVEREKRRAERQLLIKESEAKNDVGKGVVLTPYLRAAEEQRGMVCEAMERYGGVLTGEVELLKDRLRDRKEAWERRLHGETALMQNLQRAKSKEIAKINEVYTRGIIQEAERTTDVIKKLFIRLEEEADDDFRYLVINKNCQISDIEKKNEQNIKNIQTAFDELKRCDFIMHQRREMLRLKSEVTFLGKKLAKHIDIQNEFIAAKEAAEVQVKELREMEGSQKPQDGVVQERRRRLEEMAGILRNLSLETSLVEEVLESERQISAELRKDTRSEVLKTRLQLQRLQQSFDLLRDALVTEFAEHKEVLRHFFNKRRESEQIGILCRELHRQRAMKNTIADLADLTLREFSLHLQNVAPKKSGSEAKSLRRGCPDVSQTDRLYQVPKAPVGRVMKSLCPSKTGKNYFEAKL